MSVLAQATEDVTVFQMALQQRMMLQALPKRQEYNQIFNCQK